jgi:acyl carrier protein
VKEHVRAALREYVAGSTLLGRSEPLSDTTALGTAGVLDSLAIIELVLFLETEFGIEFTSRDLDRRRLGTIDQLVELVVEKRMAIGHGVARGAKAD